MDCKTCKAYRESVTRIVHESDLDRMERINKRWFVAWLITFIVLVAVVAGVVWYESQWEVVEETTTTEVSQQTDGGGNNNFVGGDYIGETNGKNNENNEKP